jgi:hypothetical protein
MKASTPLKKRSELVEEISRYFEDTARQVSGWDDKADALKMLIYSTQDMLARTQRRLKEAEAKEKVK